MIVSHSVIGKAYFENMLNHTKKVSLASLPTF